MLSIILSNAIHYIEQYYPFILSNVIHLYWAMLSIVLSNAFHYIEQCCPFIVSNVIHYIKLCYPLYWAMLSIILSNTIHLYWAMLSIYIEQCYPVYWAMLSIYIEQCWTRCVPLWLVLVGPSYISFMSYLIGPLTWSLNTNHN